MSVLRVTIIHLHETPKYLLTHGRDEDVVNSLHVGPIFKSADRYLNFAQSIAAKYNRPCSLTLEQLQSCGELKSGRLSGFSLSDIREHVTGLFATRKLGLSTALIWVSWTLIGLAYPLYNVFLPVYLKTRGADFGAGSNYTTWRNYAIVNFAGIFGPVLAGVMCNSCFLQRRGTMIVGALTTMVFFFAFVISSP
jgi:hypothetical protein